MVRYILHIGPPKTGSKYIQSQLYHNRPYLEENGVIYPDNWWVRPDQVFHEPVLRLLREKSNLKPEFDKICAKGLATVILSCEGFDALNLGEIERLRDAMGEGDVDVVYYARRWSDRIPSDWRQHVMMGHVITFPEFYARLLNRPSETGEINYSSVWDHFARVFGRDSLKIVPYSNLREHGIDLFAHFCRTVVGLPDVPQTKKGLIQHNKSPDMVEAEILRGLNYLYFLENGFNDIRIRIRFLRLRKGYALKPLYEIMQSEIREIMVNDSAPSLAATWEAISAYKDRIVSQEYGSEMFARREERVNFVGQNYLYRKGALEEVQKCYEYMRDTPLDVQELRALA
jgi:hypothetical protein